MDFPRSKGSKSLLFKNVCVHLDVTVNVCTWRGMRWGEEPLQGLVAGGQNQKYVAAIQSGTVLLSRWLPRGKWSLLTGVPPASGHM